MLRWASRFWTGVLSVTVLLVGLLFAARLLLPLLFVSPEVTTIHPQPGDSDVSPHTAIKLHFNTAMNRRSVERSVIIDPPVPAAFLWDAEHVTLTISPTTWLSPNTTYHVEVRGEASSWNFRSLEQPKEFSFRTKPAPAVVQVFPRDGASDVSTTTALSILFSHPIVPKTSLGATTDLPELHLDPPLQGNAIWVDQNLVLFRPSAPLQPATRYRATLTKGFADAQGSALGEQFSWSFSTPAPTVLSLSPHLGARGVPPQAPLVIQVSEPLDLGSVQASFAILPPTPGTFAEQRLPNGTQVLTYTPISALQPGLLYTVELRGGATPATGNIPLNKTVRWSFTTAPQPTLTGRFPGEGQILPPGQDIRLVFNTPFDPEVLRRNVRFTPPVAEFQVQARESEAHITVDVHPSTHYTITLPASLTDRNGISLGQEYALHFLSAPASPDLQIPQQTNHFVRITPGATTQILTKRTNLSALSLALYQLDEPTLVRLFAFQSPDWNTFQPERYNLPLLHDWNVSLADRTNIPAQTKLSLTTADGHSLPPGSYYLRVRTLEGPRADLVILVSQARLVVQEQDRNVLAWTIDTGGGRPVGGLPVTLYQDNLPIERGTTDQNGIWQITRSTDSRSPAVVVLADKTSFDIAGGSQLDVHAAAPPQRYHLFVTSDRDRYRPGEELRLAGFVRAIGASSSLPPHADLRLALTSGPSGIGPELHRETHPISSSGRISVPFTLPNRLPSGIYSLTAKFEGQVASITFVVQQDAMPIEVRVTPTAPLLAGGNLPFAIEVHSPTGLPIGGAIISWTVDVEPVPGPVREGYTIGNAMPNKKLITPRTGTGHSDTNGRLTLVLTDTAVSHPLRYRLRTHVTGSDGEQTQSDDAWLVAPAPTYVGIRLSSRFQMADVSGSVELLTLTSDGQHAPHVSVHLEIYRRETPRIDEIRADGTISLDSDLHDQLVSSRDIVTDADGTAHLDLRLPIVGEYRLVASSGRPPTQAISTAPLWVIAPGIPIQLEGEPILITDKLSYSPGETAQLLLLSPFREMTALITSGVRDQLRGDVRVLRAGEPFAVTVGQTDTRVNVFLPIEQNTQRRAVPPPKTDWLATIVLPISTPPQLPVAITLSQATSTPTATLTITTTGGSADIILRLTHVPLRIDRQPAALASAASFYWDPALRTSASGVHTLTLQLPAEPALLQTSVWAVGADGRFGQATTTFTTPHLFILEVNEPPFFRAGDRTELELAVHNTDTTTHAIRINLAADGILFEPGSAVARRAIVAGGATTRITWPITVDHALQANLRFTAQSGADEPQIISISREILPPHPTTQTTGGTLVTERWSQRIVTPETTPWGQLLITLAASRQGLAYELVQSLAKQTERSTLDEAALLQMSTQLSDTDMLSLSALQRLIEAQNVDGGWGWWRGSPSHPLVTATVLETFANAEAAGFTPPALVLARGNTALSTALVGRSMPADLQAYALYVLGRFGDRNETLLRELSKAPQRLSPIGLAYLLLIPQPASAFDSRAALSRLTTLAMQEGTLVYWTGPQNSELFWSNLDATASVLMAMNQLQPKSPLVLAAQRWLLAQLSNAQKEHYSQARILRAINAIGAGTNTRATLALNSTQLLNNTFDTPTSTLRISRALNELSPQNELLVTTSDEPIIAQYRLISASATASPINNGIALLREYLDPQTGLPLDPQQLHTDQLIQVRLTIIASDAQHFVSIEDPLPAGLVFVQGGKRNAFEYIGQGSRRLLLARTTLPSGIHEYTYLARALVPGHYNTPPPEAHTPAGLVGSGNAVLVRIN